MDPLILIVIAVVLIGGIAVFAYMSSRRTEKRLDSLDAKGSVSTWKPEPEPESDGLGAIGGSNGPTPYPPAPPAPEPSRPPRPIVPASEAATDEKEPEKTRGIRDRLRERAEEEEAQKDDTSKDPTQDRRVQDPDEETAVMPRPSRDPVAFTSYYPKEVAPNVWYTLLAYVYRTTSAASVDADARGTLGERARDYRRVARPEQNLVVENAEIVATPRIPGFQFNPVSAVIGFYDQWNRADFKVRAVTAKEGEVHEGVITFTVEGIIVCEIPLYLEVNSSAAAFSGTPAAAKPPEQAAPRKIYQAVFCSYSRKDIQIVERVERAYKILGFDYLRDLTTIRPGEDWDQRLLQMIEQADIFQLFWSANSATSNAVKKEWTKALELEKSRPSFIRPVFWQQPMPAPPTELGSINFAYEPTLDDNLG
ncbi:MAG: toll/interleukin-1 receptor domain-containing protein [Anaerolineae bacterium]